MPADRQPAGVSDVAETFADVKQLAVQIRRLLGDELQSVPWNIRLEVQAQLDSLDAACNHGLQMAAGLRELSRTGQRGGRAEPMKFR
jgi:hypothetical protein